MRISDWSSDVCSSDLFNRIENNYLLSLGRMAEAEGESAIWLDLRQKLFIDPSELKKQYAHSPTWLQARMDAWAGIGRASCRERVRRYVPISEVAVNLATNKS